MIGCGIFRGRWLVTDSSDYRMPIPQHQANSEAPGNRRSGTIWTCLFGGWLVSAWPGSPRQVGHL